MPPPDIQIHVKGLSLGAELKDTNARSSLKLSYQFGASSTDDEDDEESDDENEPSIVTKEVILGSLTPGKVNNVFPSLGCDVTLLFRSSRPPWTSFWMIRANTSLK